MVYILNTTLNNTHAHKKIKLNKKLIAHRASLHCTVIINKQKNIYNSHSIKQIWLDGTSWYILKKGQF